MTKTEELKSKLQEIQSSITLVSNSRKQKFIDNGFVKMPYDRENSSYEKYSLEWFKDNIKVYDPETDSYVWVDRINHLQGSFKGV